MSQALAAFNAFGSESFSNMVCQQAPYFSTIHPELVDLKPEYAEARVPFRKEITNHLGTVHAIASGQGIDWSTAGEKVVPAEVFDEDGQKVFTAQITMNVKPLPGF